MLFECFYSIIKSTSFLHVVIIKQRSFFYWLLINIIIVYELFLFCTLKKQRIPLKLVVINSSKLFVPILKVEILCFL